MASAVLKSTDVALPQLPAGWQLDTVAVLADSSLALLATNVDLAHEWRRDEKGFLLGKPGGRSSTASSAARSVASCRPDRCPGSWGGTGDWGF
jgi:hypothetical protein